MFSDSVFYYKKIINHYKKITSYIDINGIL